MKIKGFIAFSATALRYFGEKLSLALTFSNFLISNPKNIPIMLQIAYSKVYWTTFYKPKKCLTPRHLLIGSPPPLGNEDRLPLDGYTFHKANHPQNVKRGGVGLHVKDSLPSKNRPDLATLPECVVCEIQLNRKKYFSVVIYRSPSQNQNEFDNFTINFELLLSKLHAENPFCVIITGDFNCLSTQWWANDIENNEGRLFEPIASDLGLHQLT